MPKNCVSPLIYPGLEILDPLVQAADLIAHPRHRSTKKHDEAHTKQQLHGQTSPNSSRNP